MMMMTIETTTLRCCDIYIKHLLYIPPISVVLMRITSQGGASATTL